MERTCPSPKPGRRRDRQRSVKSPGKTARAFLFLGQDEARRLARLADLNIAVNAALQHSLKEHIGMRRLEAADFIEFGRYICGQVEADGTNIGFQLFETGRANDGGSHSRSMRYPVQGNLSRGS